MNLPAGRLRHRIDLYGLTKTQDPETGDITETYGLVEAGVRAEFVPLSAREFIAAQAAQATIVARVRIRYREGIAPTMRFTFRGANYFIDGVLPDPDSGYEYLTLIAATVAEGSA